MCRNPFEALNQLDATTFSSTIWLNYESLALVLSHVSLASVKLSAQIESQRGKVEVVLKEASHALEYTC